MSSGYIYMYFREGRELGLAEFEELFHTIGLTLWNPDSNQIFMISATGDQISASRERLEAEIAGKSDVGFEWWYSGCEDVYCRFSPAETTRGWRAFLGLDGLDERQADALVRCVLHLFDTHCGQGDVTAVVIDRRGSLEDIDWDDIVAGGRRRLQYIPDILILPRSMVFPAALTARNEIPECPNYVVFRREEAGT